MFYHYFTLERLRQLKASKCKLPGTVRLSGTILLMTLCLGQLTGCQSTKATSTMDQSNPVDPTMAGLLTEYRIGVSDTLQISVWRNADLSAQVVVLPDGNISVPLAGQVKAVGETTETLATKISETLKTFIRQPEVTVSVLSASSSEFLQRVRITGAVNAPTSLNFRRGLTVLDIVLLAGGITPFANANDSLLYRKEGEVLKIYPVRLSDILTKGKLETNYAVLPSDIITVPEKSF